MHICTCRVQAMYKCLQGNPSEPASFTTLCCEPDTPVPPRKASGTKNCLVLQWKVVHAHTHTHCTHAHISLLHTKSHFFCKLSLRVCAVVINKQSDYEQSSFIININVLKILLCKVITSQCTFGNLVSL